MVQDDSLKRSTMPIMQDGYFTLLARTRGGYDPETEGYESNGVRYGRKIAHCIIVQSGVRNGR